MLFNFSDYFTGKCEKHCFNDNDSCRIAAYFTQNGRCFVTGRDLLINFRHLHHRLPVDLGGKDTPENLVLLDKRVHHMVHTHFKSTFNSLAEELELTDEELDKIRQLRYEAGTKFAVNS